MSNDPNEHRNQDKSTNTPTPASDKRATNPKNPSAKKLNTKKARQSGGYENSLQGVAAPQSDNIPREFPMIDPDDDDLDEVADDDDREEDDDEEE